MYLSQLVLLIIIILIYLKKENDILVLKQVIEKLSNEKQAVTLESVSQVDYTPYIYFLGTIGIFILVICVIYNYNDGFNPDPDQGKNLTIETIDSQSVNWNEIRETIVGHTSLIKADELASEAEFDLLSSIFSN